MRAFLVDPEKQTVTEIQLDGHNYREINAMIGCDTHTMGAWLAGSYEEGFDAIWVSDDELTEEDDPRFFFQVDANTDHASYPISSRGVALGTDKDGEACDARITLDRLTKRVTFQHRKIRGFRTSEIPGGIKLDIDAPLIDGTNEKTKEG